MMRREGFELQVSRPEIVTKEIDGVKMEPVEDLVIDVPEEFQGVVIAQAGTRRGVMTQDGESRQRPRAARVPHSGARPDRLPVAVPDRHQGHRHHEPPVRRLGAVARRDRRARRPARWSPIASGVATAYAIYNLQERGEIFIEPGDARSTRG